MFRNDTFARFAALPLLLCAVVLYLAASTAVAAAESSGKSFYDVADDHWAYGAVQDMIGNGIIDGYDDGSFHPDDPLTREQFAKLLTLALDEPLQPAAEATFSDVSPDMWSYLYIETVKPYLEGYTLPIGKPFFEPGALLTREDVAVALVKSMKLRTDGVDARSIVESSLTDYGDISPGLDLYVAVALQNGLIEGYPDGTFKPHDGLNRAAAATLLGRLLQSPAMPKLKEIELTVNAPPSADRPSIQISGTVAKEAKLTLYGKDVPHNGSFTIPLDFPNGDGDYTLEFRAVKPNGRYRTVVKHVRFAIPEPKLTAEAPASSERQKVTVKGTVSDINDANPVVRVNDEQVNVAAGGTWSKEVSLDEGDNAIIITAANVYDKTFAMEKNVTFTAKPPEMKMDDLPETVHTKSLKVTGRITDMNDPKPQITLNGQAISSLDFAVTVPLKEGDNTFVLVAKNRWGKTTTATKTVSYVILPPEITLDSIVDVSLASTITISGSATDANDPEPSFYVNDRYVSKKSFSMNVTLKEGDNSFTIKATNNLGKTSIVEKKITYVIMPPNLYVEPLPETSTLQTITIKASAYDTIDRAPDLYLNNQYIGESSFTRTMTLKEGLNTVSVKASNSSGKSAFYERTIHYTPPPPAITLDDWPASTTSKTLSYKVTATDPNDKYPSLYVNNQYVSTSSYSGTITLKEGVNAVVFKATNAAGKSAEIMRTITFEVAGPVISVDPLSETSTSNTATLVVRASDPNDSGPQLYLNGQLMQRSGFTKTVTLAEGENVFTIKATNSFGKSTEVVKRIVYTAPGPTVTVGSLPATTSTPTLIISASATDPNDTAPILYLNGQAIQARSIAKEVTLAAGPNTFEIKAINKNGKVSNVVNITVTYTPPAAAPK